MILFSCFAGILLLVSKTNAVLSNDDNEQDGDTTSVNDAIVEELPESRTLESFIKRASPNSNKDFKSENHCSSLAKRY